MTTTKPLTPKQSAFVDLRVNTTLSATECYRQAGYTTATPGTARAGAARLLATSSVSGAIARQLAAKVERTTVDQDRLVGYALAVYHAAMAAEEYGNANASVVTLGRLTGLLQDKRTVTVNHDRDAVREELARLFTFEELLAMREQLALAEPTVTVDAT